MYNTKRRIYGYFDKTQKSMLCTFLRSYVGLGVNVNVNDEDKDNITPDELLDKFIDEQEYYLKIGASRYSFIEPYLNDDTFLSETKEYIAAVKKYYDYKKSQAPLIVKQKEYEKKKRKFLQEVKMSKQEPTKKQLYYYERLCKKYNLDKIDVEKASRLDLRNEIDKILNEHSGNCRDISEERD